MNTVPVKLYGFTAAPLGLYKGNAQQKAWTTYANDMMGLCESATCLKHEITRSGNRVNCVEAYGKKKPVFDPSQELFIEFE